MGLFTLLRRGRDLNELKETLDRRRVVLVGNASSFKETVETLADFETVVRINDGPFHVAERWGRWPRTDVLLVSAFDEPRFLEAAPHVVWMTPKQRETLATAARRRLYFYPIRWWRAPQAELGARPSTGCMGIDLVCRLAGTDRLWLWGFDFWQTPTNYTGQTHIGPHAPPQEEVFARSRVGAERIMIPQTAATPSVTRA